MNRNLMLLVLIAGCCAPFAAAQDGWDLSVGAGVAQTPVYEGSESYFMSPFPSVDVSYTTGGLSISASILNGLGVSYMHEGRGLLGSVSVSPGAERDSESYSFLATRVDHDRRTRELLEDTPTVRTVVAADATLGVLTPVGLLGATAGYRPSVVEYDGGDGGAGGGTDETYQAFVGSLFYMIGMPVTERLSVMAVLSLELMDADYADAWFSVEESTTSLDAFDADAGVRAAQLALEGSYMFADHFGLSLTAGEMLMLGDAAESPYTRGQFQTVAMLEAFYSLR
ncbi:MAG: MipA/OmpV family protein [Spirochaetia bacterium]